MSINGVSKNKIKWVLLVVAILLLAVMVAAAMTSGFTDINPYGWLGDECIHHFEDGVCTHCGAVLTESESDEDSEEVNVTNQPMMNLAFSDDVIACSGDVAVSKNCPYCGADGLDTCPYCTDGNQPNVSTCISCNGSGTADVDCTACVDGYILGAGTCPFCSGDGCEECNYTGADFYSDCEACGGLGTISGSCTICGGDGLVDGDCTICGGDSICDCLYCGGNGSRSTYIQKTLTASVTPASSTTGYIWSLNWTSANPGKTASDYIEIIPWDVAHNIEAETSNTILVRCYYAFNNPMTITCSATIGDATASCPVSFIGNFDSAEVDFSPFTVIDGPIIDFYQIIDGDDLELSITFSNSVGVVTQNALDDYDVILVFDNISDVDVDIKNRTSHNVTSTISVPIADIVSTYQSVTGHSYFDIKVDSYDAYTNQLVISVEIPSNLYSDLLIPSNLYNSSNSYCVPQNGSYLGFGLEFDLGGSDTELYYFLIAVPAEALAMSSDGLVF